MRCCNSQKGRGGRRPAGLHKLAAWVSNLLRRRFPTGGAFALSRRLGTGRTAGRLKTRAKADGPSAPRFRWQLAAALLIALPNLAGITRAETIPVKPSFHANLNAASAAAATDQSLVLLIFSAEWCGPCRLLKKETLASEEFLHGGGALRVVQIDVDADAKTTRAFGATSVPALVLLSADGKIIARKGGFMTTPELLSWIGEGRRRLAQGEWEGIAPGAQLEALAARAAAGRLTAEDFKALVAMLGEPDPAERSSVAKLILAQREEAVPPLIDALKDPYLGVRIAAGELLQRLSLDEITVDPWQSPAALSETVAGLKQWWGAQGKLPPAGQARAVDPSVQGSIQLALEAMRGGDAVRRTEAMSTLVLHGAAALPAVREAVRRLDRGGDHRAVTLLEDVRWAILISDAVERRAGGVRQALARGASPERQAAAAQLGRAGREALEALSELANDPDPLVIESAVRALSGIGGADAVPAMAGLLRAADSNLRMTAAQALGRTRNSAATRHLLSALDDPNDVVASAALAALEQIHSRGFGEQQPLAPEIVAGLKQSLEDPRWRMRAAAAEVAGKLRATGLADVLKTLLDDPDGFVVKNTLVALKAMGAAPDTSQLIELARRLPSLRADAVQMLIEADTEEAAAAVTAMFDESGPDEKLVILNILLREGDDVEDSEEHWKPLLTRAARAPDPRLRRAAVQVLGLWFPNLAAGLIGPLLGDEDVETHVAAAEVLLGVLSGKRGAGLHAMFPGLSIEDFEDAEMFFESQSTEKTEGTTIVPEQIAEWHKVLKQRAGPAPEPFAALAIYATGDAKADLLLLAAGLEKLDPKTAKQLSTSPALGIVLPKLPWPESESLLNQFSRSPWLFAKAVRESQTAAPEVAAYLLEPARFKSAVEPLEGDDLAGALRLLLGGGGPESWSLTADSEPAGPIVSALLESTNAAWRAAAVYALGRREPRQGRETIAGALEDPNPWVREAAVRAFVRSNPERELLESRLGPLLADAERRVAEAAAIGLLDSELRQAAGLHSEFQFFFFEKVRTGRSEHITPSETRPLMVIDAKPAFLDDARRRLAGSKPVESAPLALLLAQFGEFDGIDLLTASPAGRTRSPDRALLEPTLAGIALSRDPKYVPFLRTLIEQPGNEWELRNILRALRGMTGTEARQVRLEINKRMRASGD